MVYYIVIKFVDDSRVKMPMGYIFSNLDRAVSYVLGYENIFGELCRDGSLKSRVKYMIYRIDVNTQKFSLVKEINY